MDKLRRILIISIVLILITMSNVLAASTFPDVQDTEYEEAVINLVELDILAGFPNSDFGVDENVTKAEMSAIIVRCMGLETLARVSQGVTMYKDVPANHWASGYINVISDYQYMDINEDENFYPDENVTVEEAITYCIRMLGYRTIVDEIGTWPYNYKSKAYDLELLDGISTTKGDITRGDLSILLWNSLNTKMWTINSTKQGTLLEIKFPGYEKYEKKYKVEVISDSNGTVTVDKTEVVDGEKVTITVVPNEGYELYELNVDYGRSKDLTSKVKDGKVSINCEENDIKIEAIFNLIEVMEEPDEPSEPIESTKVKTVINVSPDYGDTVKNYNGREQELIIRGFDAAIMDVTGNKATEVGEYKVIISVKDSESYAVSYKGISGESVEIDWRINENSLLLPTAPKREYEYTGQEIELEIHDVNEYTVDIVGNKATEVGEYEAICSLKDSKNYIWADGSTDDKKLKWKIISVDVPEQEENDTSTEEKNNDKVKDEVIENEPEEEIKTYKAKILQSKGGKITTKTKTVEEGKNQTFTITPDEGYRIVDVKVDGESVGAVYKYTIRNVKKVHEITAEFEEIEVKEEIKTDIDEEVEDFKNQFEDIKEESWYFESVKYATTTGLFKGVSDNEFAPNVTMNRAMLVTVLYRLDGEKSTNHQNNFRDIESGSYYENAVNWATKNNIVSGISENEFAPSNQITREQLVVMLYRFAKMNGINVNEKADLSIFEDVNEISDYAKDATAWAVKAGYINGRSEKVLAPKESATRAEVATILMRFSGN